MTDSRTHITSILNLLQIETKLHIINIQFNDSYFLFKGGKDSICTFNIKELKGFKFCIWSTARFDSIEYQIKHKIGLWSDRLEVPTESQYILFTQYELFIDKFKPTTSNLLCGIYNINDINNLDDWYLTDAIDMLLYMKNHKIESIYYASTYGKYIWNYRNIFSICRCIIPDIIYAKWYDYKYNNYDKKLQHKCRNMLKRLKCFRCVATKCKYIVHTIDIHLCLNDTYTEKDVMKDKAIIDKFVEKYYNDLDVIYYNDPEQIYTGYNKTKQDFDSMIKHVHIDKFTDIVYDKGV